MADIFDEMEIQDITVQHKTLNWEADFCDVFGGPVEVRYEDKIIIRNHRFYIDDLDNNYAVTQHQRKFHKGGSAVVSSEGYFPFGSELGFMQNCRFAMNHFRITFDLKWFKGTQVKRHFGLGCLEMPGRFVRYWCLPPANHQIEGKKAEWINLPIATEEKIMVGHWHRPPMALVFEREDGILIEIGTGSDIWRWEENLGAGPETGSYKIFLTKDGIIYNREPLMTCQPFSPEVRPYRFSWYVAWGKKEMLKSSSLNYKGAMIDFTSDNNEPIIIPNKDNCYFVDFSQIKIPENAQHAILSLDNLSMTTNHMPCWEAAAIQKITRRLIRKIQSVSKNEISTLIFKELTPSCCWNASHLERGHRVSMPHWDINSILDFLVWTKQQLGEQWNIVLDLPEDYPLISLRGGQFPLGFSLTEVE